MRTFRVARGSLLVVLGLVALPARAYPIFIKHGYAACATCHQDPSGAGLLTPYGRAQTQLLLETQYRAPSPDGEVSKTTRPFLGVPVPEWLLVGFTFRGGVLVTHSGSAALAPSPAMVRPLIMVADLRAGIRAGIFRMATSLGYVARGAEEAALTDPTQLHLLVSRDHWAGVSLADDAVLLRGGRMNVPYGLRNVEHLLWVRDLTHTNINEQQQYGVATAYNTERIRTEVMAIAGNFLLRDDANRERGYSGYFEYAALQTLAVGVSSQVTYARQDLNGVDANRVRQAHGLFARYGPSPQVALLAEADLLFRQATGLALTPGYAALAQVDYEPIRGLHGILSLEASDLGGAESGGTSVGAWLGVAWFAIRALELRVDAILRRVPSPVGPPVVQTTVIGQAHVYL